MADSKIPRHSLKPMETDRKPLIFLGNKIDIQWEQIHLPQDKLGQLTGTIAAWMSRSEQPPPRSSGKKQDLLSLLGLLHHTASVVRLGREFLHSLINAAAAVKELDHWVHLNSSARADLAWWHTFVWNRTSIMPPAGAPLQLVSDASGTWGCGAYHSNCWFQFQWPESWAAVSIALKELVLIVVAATLWCPQ